MQQAFCGASHFRASIRSKLAQRSRTFDQQAVHQLHCRVTRAAVRSPHQTGSAGLTPPQAKRRVACVLAAELHMPLHESRDLGSARPRTLAAMHCPIPPLRLDQRVSRLIVGAGLRETEASQVHRRVLQTHRQVQWLRSGLVEVAPTPCASQTIAPTAQGGQHRFVTHL